MIAFAALGNAQTTRQGRSLAVAVAVVAVVALRIAGFAASSVTVRTPLGILAVYGAPVATMVVCLAISLRQAAMSSLTDRLSDLALRLVRPLHRIRSA
jgi:lipopolysaccharide export system permease protein